MRAAVVILSIAVVILGALYIHNVSHPQLRTLVVTNQVVAPVAPQGDVGDIKTQLEKQTARVTELEQQVGTLEIERKKIEDQLNQSQRSVQEGQSRIADLEAARQNLANQLTTVSSQLAAVQDQLSALKRTNAANEEQIRALNQQKAALEQEKTSLEARLNNLDSLRAEVRRVKHELWEQRVAEWKRQDAALAAKGNHGFLMQNGTWRVLARPGSSS